MRKCSTRKKDGMKNKNNDTDPFLASNHKSGLIRTFIRLLYMMVKTSKVRFALQLSVSVIGGCLPVLVALLWKNLLDKITNLPTAANNLSLLSYFLVFALVGGLSVSFYYFSEIVDTFFRNEISLKFQDGIHQKSQKVPVAFYEVPQLNDIINRAQNAFCYGPAVGAALNITHILSVIASLIASVGILSSFHYSLAILLVGVSLPYIIKLLINRIKFDFTVRSSPKRREAEIYSRYFTKYEYIKETQILDAKTFFIDKWLKVMNFVRRDEIKTNLKTVGIETVIEIFESAGYVFSIFLTVYLINKKIIGIGEFGAIVILLGQMKDNITRFFGDIAEMHELLCVVEKGFEYLDLKEEDRPIHISPEIKEDIVCENVSYAYPLNQEKVIDGVDICIKQGEVIALVGSNGAGKSTLAKILLGLLTPDEGRIKYDGTDIKNLAYQSVYKNASAVFQDFVHYYLSIQENIGLGDISKLENTDLILDAAKKSGAISFVNSLPEGINTVLGKEYGGMELSGGQWQQLALARGYFRDSSFVVLDEPSSALDPVKEAEMYENFRRLCNGKTGIIITHRLGAASLADRIFLIEKGCIVEEGNHSELCNKKGKYWRMFEAQASMYRANNCANDMQ